MIGRGRVRLPVLTVGYEIGRVHRRAEICSTAEGQDSTTEFAQCICPEGPGSGGSVNCWYLLPLVNGDEEKRPSCDKSVTMRDLT